METELGVSLGGWWSLLAWPLTWLASCVMVLGGVVPYVPQYQEIQRTGNTEGFSTRVCLVLLVANILRIFFWIGKQFEMTLLLQSLVMILTMLIMLHLCCTIQSTNRVSTKQHHITDLDLYYFWCWSSFEDYVLFCFGFTLLCAFITLLFLDLVVFVEALGSLAVLFEAMLGMPQLLQNYSNRSTQGMSVDLFEIDDDDGDRGVKTLNTKILGQNPRALVQFACSIKMVILWTAGDIFKTIYFVINESPTQFWVCGAAQILIDILILLQNYV